MRVGRSTPVPHRHRHRRFVVEHSLEGCGCSCGRTAPACSSWGSSAFFEALTVLSYGDLVSPEPRCVGMASPTTRSGGRSRSYTPGLTSSRIKELESRLKAIESEASEVNSRVQELKVSNTRGAASDTASNHVVQEIPPFNSASPNRRRRLRTAISMAKAQATQGPARNLEANFDRAGGASGMPTETRDAHSHRLRQRASLGDISRRMPWSHSLGQKNKLAPALNQMHAHDLHHGLQTPHGHRANVGVPPIATPNALMATVVLLGILAFELQEKNLHHILHFGAVSTLRLLSHVGI